MRKNDRNMFYSDYQAGGFINPNMNMQQNMNMNQGMMPMMQEPSGYMMNNNYVAYGPNALPQQYNTYEDTTDYESRIIKLERAVRKLESRVSKLESSTDIIEEENNLYII